MKKKNNDEFAKAKNDIKRIGIFTCCLIGVLLIISLFIDTEKSYAADFLEKVPDTFTSVISQQTDTQSSHQLLIKDDSTGNDIELPRNFSAKLEDGTILSYIYCIDRRLNMNGNITYNKLISVKEAIPIARAADETKITKTAAYPGLIYILQKNKEYLGSLSAEKEYYYTQLAVWWYIDRANGFKDDTNYDRTTGTELSGDLEVDGDSKYDDNNNYKYLNNLSVLDKKTIAKDKNYGEKIKALVTAAEENGKNYIADNQTKDLTIHSNDSYLESFADETEISLEEISLKVAGDYVETDLIKITSKNTRFESYDVDLDTEITGYEIVDENNKLLNPTELLSGQSFKIRIPVENVKNNTFKAKINITGYYKDLYNAYIYDTENKNTQRALLGEIEKETMKLVVNIEPKKIDTPDTALSATVVYIAGGLIIAFGILLIVVAMKPKNAKKNK